MKTPILETTRLILRPMTAADAETVFANWTSDPEVAKFMRWTPHKNVEDTIEWLTSVEAAIESADYYNWGLVLKETGELIGSAGLIFQEDKGMYEPAYNLMKKYWNQGLATEALEEMIIWGRDVLGQKKFYCCHAKDNPASGKVMMKVGFVYQNDGEYYSSDRTRRFESKEYLLEL